MMVSVAGFFVILFSLGAVFWIVLKNVPKVALVADYELEYLRGRRPFWRVVLSFIAKKQKIITRVLITKAIRRLKVVSLKTDNLASSLLEKIQSRDDNKD